MVALAAGGIDTQLFPIIVFIVLNTNDLEAGGEYELILEAAETSDYFDTDPVSAQFSVVEPSIEITGDVDDEDRLEVENNAQAPITGESNAAPGTDVEVCLRATGEDPFLMSQTVQVQEDGSVEAEFDLSEHQAGQEFTVTMSYNAQDQVNAILVESTENEETRDGDDRYSADEKGDDHRSDDKKSGDKKDGDDRRSDDEKSGNTKGDDTQNDEKQDTGNDDGDDNNEQPGSGASDEQPGFGIAVALIALLAAAGRPIASSIVTSSPL